MTTEQDRFWDELRRERFLLVGSGGITGTAAARLFRRMGVPFKVADPATTAALAALISELGLRETDVFLGPHQTRQLDGITQILISPGVPRAIPLLVEARARHIPIWCDFDLLYPIYASKRIAAITGTDGKTTTTALLGHLLSPSLSVVVAGNIGTPICAIYDELLQSDVLILELSSFMLEDLKRFRADVSTVLNIAEDHIDRYPSKFEYAETKRNIVRHARATDVFVKNSDDQWVSSWDLPELTIQTVSVSQIADIYLDVGQICLGEFRFPVNQLQIRGRHLVGDAMFAVVMARALGLPIDVALPRAATFCGVPHRFEYVAMHDGIQIIDDSKATSVQSVECALESLGERQVVLILGGRDKSLDPTPLRRFADRLRAVVGYGEAGQRLIAPFEQTEVHYAYEFHVAVRIACESARRGDVLLLSPACTSFDQHRDYQERGRQFRALADCCLG